MTDKPTFSREQLRKPLTNASIAPLMAGIAPVIKQAIADATAPLQQRVEALEERVESFSYKGVYRSGEVYRKGNFCTFAGSVWHCVEATLDAPTENHSAWVLAVKRGRDGKDGDGVRTTRSHR